MTLGHNVKYRGSMSILGPILELECSKGGQLERGDMLKRIQTRPALHRVHPEYPDTSEVSL